MQDAPASIPEQHERLVGDLKVYSFHTAGLPRLSISAREAAVFVGIGTTFSHMLVDGGTMPRSRVLEPRRLWTTVELSAAFSMLPREGKMQEESDPWSDTAAWQPAINHRLP